MVLVVTAYTPDKIFESSSANSSVLAKLQLNNYFLATLNSSTASSGEVELHFPSCKQSCGVEVKSLLRRTLEVTVFCHQVSGFNLALVHSMRNAGVHFWMLSACKSIYPFIFDACVWPGNKNNQNLGA